MPKYSITIVDKNNKKTDEIQALLRGFTFSLNGCGYQEGYLPENSCDNRIIIDYELIYFLHGSGEIGIEGITYQPKAGMLFLIPPFTRHYIHSSSQDPYKDYWVHFQLEPFWNARQFIHSITDEKGSYCTEIGYHPHLIELFRQLYQEMNGEKPGSGLMSELLFQQIIVSLVRLRQDRSDSMFTGSADIVRSEAVLKHAMQYVREHVDSSISVSEMAAASGVSESYLYKCFSKTAGMTPNMFIQTVKARRAKYLIETTDLSLAEISGELGFSSYYYFSAFFKKMYGVAPRVFKQSKDRIDKLL